jgi:hypothetical protein
MERTMFKRFSANLRRLGQGRVGKPDFSLGKEGKHTSSTSLSGVALKRNSSFSGSHLGTISLILRIRLRKSC